MSLSLFVIRSRKAQIKFMDGKSVVNIYLKYNTKFQFRIDFQTKEVSQVTIDACKERKLLS